MGDGQFAGVAAEQVPTNYSQDPQQMDLVEIMGNRIFPEIVGQRTKAIGRSSENWELGIACSGRAQAQDCALRLESGADRLWPNALNVAFRPLIIRLESRNAPGEPAQVGSLKREAEL